MNKYSLGLWVAALSLGCSGEPQSVGPDASPVTTGIEGESAVRAAVQPGGATRECFRYDSYLAALGELTAQCLGTVDSRLYHVGEDGLLTPSFRSCPLDPSRMSKIKQVLSVQRRGERAPFAAECLVERFEAAQEELNASGITSCPTWSKSRVINAIGHDTIAVVERSLSEPSAEVDARLSVDAPGVTRASLTLLDSGSELAAPPLNVFDLLEENSLYRVTSPLEGKGCESASACAATCAKAFTGFVVGAKGPQEVVTDPIAWLTDTTYKTSLEDPYLRATYYHPMSYYGGVPGVVFGDPNRAEPCGPNTTCLPELCTYYAGSHIKTRMQMDCLIPGDIETCASYCGPPLPKP
ncbi:MAG: hypothetical protein EOO73_05055 [Myxococcales bacterium]|nr:MAG: hypothetical protein EOO73_05055 [Myxococcales bacterium]